MHFTTRTGGNFTNYIVKSSPYVTVKFDDATPVIGSDVMKIMYVKKRSGRNWRGQFVNYGDARVKSARVGAARVGAVSGHVDAVTVREHGAHAEHVHRQWRGDARRVP